MAKKSIFSAKKTKNQARKKVSDIFFCLYSWAIPRLWTEKKSQGMNTFTLKNFCIGPSWNTNSPSILECAVQCTAGELDDIEHALLRCNKIKPVADLLLKILKSEIPDLTLDRIKYLDFRSEDLLVPTYLTAATLSQLWISRFSTRNFSWQSVRANIEQSILTLRKSRFKSAATKIHSMWNENVHELVPDILVF